MNIFKKLIYYGEKDKRHNVLRIFGIGFNFLKPELKCFDLDNIYTKNMDIEKLPKAQGLLRDVQLANFAILKELDNVCKQNGFRYWLDFGTLLGAVRHKGFIPWDDDIDVGMIRNDYENIIKVFDNCCTNPDIYCSLHRDPHSTATCFIKVKHRKLPQAFVDVFPYDFFHSRLTKKEKNKLNRKINSIKKILNKENKSYKTIEELHKFQLEIISEKILEGKNSLETDKPSLLWGIDFLHNWKNWVYDYEQIFPLGEMEFENKMFPVPNEYKSVLTNMYKDYMKLPGKIRPQHTAMQDLPKEQIDIMKKLSGMY